MSLETLKNITKIGGFDVYQDNKEANGKWADVDAKYSICIHHGDNTLSFRIQNGPIKEVGVNGCQIDTIIHTAKLILERLNNKFPCRENAVAITKLDETLHWLEHRAKNRTSRGVEGTSQH